MPPPPRDAPGPPADPSRSRTRSSPAIPDTAASTTSTKSVARASVLSRRRISRDSASQHRRPGTCNLLHATPDRLSNTLSGGRTVFPDRKDLGRNVECVDEHAKRSVVDLELDDDRHAGAVGGLPHSGIHSHENPGIHPHGCVIAAAQSLDCFDELAPGRPFYHLPPGGGRTDSSVMTWKPERCSSR